MVPMASTLLLSTEGPAFSTKSAVPYTLCETSSKEWEREPQKDTPREGSTQEDSCSQKLRLQSRDVKSEDWLASQLSQPF